MTAREDRARELLAAVEAESAELAALRELHDGIGVAAQHAANATVAVLTLLPYVGADQRAVDLLGDIMDELGKTVSKLAGVQVAGMAVVHSAQARADALVAEHSVRV